MNIYVEFASEVFKVREDMETAIRADFNSTELLEQNESKGNTEGGIWVFGELGDTLASISPRSGDGPITELYSKCLAACHKNNLTEVKSLVENLYNLFEQIVYEYKNSWEEQELAIPSLPKLNPLLNELRLNTQHLPSEHLLPGAAPNPPKKRGRKPASKKQREKERLVQERWIRAKESGIARADFALDIGMTVRQLDLLLRRVKKREKAK